MANDNSCAHLSYINIRWSCIRMVRLNKAQSKEFLGMKYAPGVMHHKTKTKEFKVTSYEKVWYEQYVEVPEVYVDGQYDESETKDLAVEKACDQCEWGNPEGGEVEEQIAEEVGIDK